MRKILAILLLTGTTFLTGCGDSENFVFTNTNIPVQQLPVAVNDAYTTDENTQLTVNATGGVLANDTPNGGTITAFDATSAQGATVNVNADGSLTYTPGAFTGADTFTYTLTNGAGSDTATVTITVQAVNGFFVDSVNGDDGTGSFQGGNPYATIQAAVADAPTNADIVVRAGNYTGAVNLKNGQRLLGSGSVLAQGTGVRPQLTGPVVLADGNTLDFLRIENSPDDSIDGDGQNGATITFCEIINSGGEGIQARPGTGTWTVTNNTISDCVGIGVRLGTEGSGQMTALVNDNTLTDNDTDAMSLVTANSSQLIAQIHGNTITGNQTGATFEAFSFGTADVCLDMEDNTNDDVYVFDRSATATLEVEQLADGVGFAGNTGAIDNGAVGEPATSVADGACGF